MRVWTVSMMLFITACCFAQQRDTLEVRDTGVSVDIILPANFHQKLVDIMSRECPADSVYEVGAVFTIYINGVITNDTIRYKCNDVELPSKALNSYFRSLVVDKQVHQITLKQYGFLYRVSLRRG